MTENESGAKVTSEAGTALRRSTIVSKDAESALITSFNLRPADGVPPAPHRAGQHLTLFADLPGKGRVKRNYSISAAPNGESYRISVKREAQGLVSRWLHDEAEVGTPLLIAPPSGSFVLPESDARPVVLLSAGVGLTPMVAMLEAAAAERPDLPIHFIHCAQNGTVHAFRDHVRELVSRRANLSATFVYSRPEPGDEIGRDYDEAGPLTLDRLAALATLAEAEIYVCGPLRFLRAFVPGLAARGVPMGRLHYEFFGAMEDLFGDPPAEAPTAGTAAPGPAYTARATAGFTRETIGATLIDSAADAIIASDRAGDIVLWNAGAARIFGFTQDEALGQSLDIIIPEPFRARHWEGYHETVASGESRYGAGDMLSVPGLHKEGRRLSLEFTIALMKDEGRVTGMVASLRDVTARFNETQALKKKLAAAEEAATAGVPPPG
ncbi:PAS domain S-box protein [Ancylobacter sp. SL191]|uniref:PAS domain S-box protein n=1 Tax=Ancylobacter sp. SL191 TaxID=2995166 RepID=UPI002D1E3E6F|nr:PAS domain S-box protein [Ancylobacter sp. SL191]